MTITHEQSAMAQYGSLSNVTKTKRVAAVYGSRRTLESAEYYQSAMEFSRKVAGMGYIVRTGGGSGIMEAANRGAHGVDPKLSEGVSLRQITDREPPNAFIAPGGLRAEQSFGARKAAIAKGISAAIFYPGSTGTFDEFFDLLDVIKCGLHDTLGLNAECVVICVGAAFWEPLRSFHKAVGLTFPEFVRIVDSAEDALQLVPHPIEAETEIETETETAVTEAAAAAAAVLPTLAVESASASASAPTSAFKSASASTSRSVSALVRSAPVSSTTSTESGSDGSAATAGEAAPESPATVGIGVSGAGADLMPPLSLSPVNATAVAADFDSPLSSPLPPASAYCFDNDNGGGGNGSRPSATGSRRSRSSRRRSSVLQFHLSMDSSVVAGAGAENAKGTGLQPGFGGQEAEAAEVAKPGIFRVAARHPELSVIT